MLGDPPTCLRPSTERMTGELRIAAYEPKILLHRDCSLLDRSLPQTVMVGVAARSPSTSPRFAFVREDSLYKERSRHA